MIPLIKDRITAFQSLGKKLKKTAHAIDKENPSLTDTPAEKKLFNAGINASLHNAWFTKENVCKSLEALGHMLMEEKLVKWIEEYPELFNTGKVQPKTVAVIMAGNIPMVGFHDFLCVLISGHRFLGKLSSQDKKLPVCIGNLLLEINPGFKESIGFKEGPVAGFDAAIATGSNNSARYFDYYFGKYPHIIRKNRSSLAVLNGNESKEELTALGEDVFSYFGLGCRNVSKLMVPANYSFDRLREAWKNWEGLINHSKYFNNYDYQKAVLLVNKEPHTDVGFCLLKEDVGLSSPVSMIYCEKYPDQTQLEKYLKSWKGDLQCIVASPQIKIQAAETLPFGKSQQPELWDYADGVDTLRFLINL